MNVQIEMTSFFVGMVNRDKNNFKFLISSGVPKNILLKTYKMFIRDELFLPIELLLKEEKMKLVDKCRETGLRFTNESLSDAARILQTLNLINGNS